MHGGSGVTERSVKEWIGRSPDSAVPPRVRLRVYLKDAGICQCGCSRRITAGAKWETDHTISLANGGENREANLRTLLYECHKAKTKQDVTLKSKTYARRLKNLGIKKRKGPAMPGSKESPWKKTFNNGWVKR
jgi:5-methylcytosine-specific restriction protein A